MVRTCLFPPSGRSSSTRNKCTAGSQSQLLQLAGSSRSDRSGCTSFTQIASTPTLGAMQAGPHLRAAAVRSCLSFAAYGLILLLVPWPRLLTYITTVWLARNVIGALMAFKGWDAAGVDQSLMTEEGRRRHRMIQAAGAGLGIVIVAICAFFFGF